MGNGFKLSYRCILCTIYIHRLPARNREGWEGREGRVGVGVGGVHLLEIGRVARVGRVVLIVGAFLWKMGSNLLILCAILPATSDSRDDGCMGRGWGRGAYFFLLFCITRSHCLVLRLCIRIAFHMQYSKQYYADQQKPASVKSL